MTAIPDERGGRVVRAAILGLALGVIAVVCVHAVGSLSTAGAPAGHPTRRVVIAPPATDRPRAVLRAPVAAPAVAPDVRASPVHRHPRAQESRAVHQEGATGRLGSAGSSGAISDTPPARASGAAGAAIEFGFEP
jgi:hypothetical protein